MTPAAREVTAAVIIVLAVIFALLVACLTLLALLVGAIFNLPLQMLRALRAPAP